jgi:predicted transcriptional regulator
MSEASRAIEALERLGLTEYEARCFVALAQLPHGTAGEVGQVANIPRSRVYETMERLYDRGFVEIHNADPKEYQGVSVDTALEHLRDEYDAYFETVEESLRDLEPAYKKAEQGVWAINSHEQGTRRVVELLDDADDEDLLDAAVRDGLEAAGERGLAVHVGTCADAVRERVPEAAVDGAFTTDLIEWFTEMDGSPRIGRLLMVDRGPVLASALHEEELPGIPNETAVWTDGIDHGFATFAERVFTYELKENVEAYDGAT